MPRARAKISSASRLASPSISRGSSTLQRPLDALVGQLDRLEGQERAVRVERWPCVLDRERAVEDPRGDRRVVTAVLEVDMALRSGLFDGPDLHLVEPVVERRLVLGDDALEDQAGPVLLAGERPVLAGCPALPDVLG